SFNDNVTRLTKPNPSGFLPKSINPLPDSLRQPKPVGFFCTVRQAKPVPLSFAIIFGAYLFTHIGRTNKTVSKNPCVPVNMNLLRPLIFTPSVLLFINFQG